jgi:hypothetical protein
MTSGTSCCKLESKGWKLEVGDEGGTIGQGDPYNQIMAQRRKGQ